MKLKLLVTLSLLVLVAVFSLQNAAPVTVRFLLWHFTASQALLIFGCAVAGLVAGFLGSLALRGGNKG